MSKGEEPDEIEVKIDAIFEEDSYRPGEAVAHCVQIAAGGSTGKGQTLTDKLQQLATFLAESASDPGRADKPINELFRPRTIEDDDWLAYLLKRPRGRFATVRAMIPRPQGADCILVLTGWGLTDDPWFNDRASLEGLNVTLPDPAGDKR